MDADRRTWRCGAAKEGDGITEYPTRVRWSSVVGGIPGVWYEAGADEPDVSE